MSDTGLIIRQETTQRLTSERYGLIIRQDMREGRKGDERGEGERKREKKRYKKNKKGWKN